MLEEVEFSLGDTDLNAKSKIQAVGSLVVTVLRYNFGITNWCQGELRKLDGKTRKLLTNSWTASHKGRH